MILTLLLFLVVFTPLLGVLLLHFSSWGHRYPRPLAQIIAGLTFFFSLLLLTQPSNLLASDTVLRLGLTTYTDFLLSFFTLLFLLLIVLSPMGLRYIQEVSIIFVLQLGISLLLLSTHLFFYFLACALLSFPFYWKLRSQPLLQREIRIFLVFQIAKLLLFALAFLSLYLDLPSDSRAQFTSIPAFLLLVPQVKISLLTSFLFAFALLVQIGFFPFHLPSLTLFQRARYGGLIAYLFGHLVFASHLKFGGVILTHVLAPVSGLLYVLLLLNALYFAILSLSQFNLRRLILSSYLSFLSLGFTLFLTPHKQHLLFSTVELLTLALVFGGILSALWLAESRLDVDDIVQYQGIASRVPGLSAYFLLLVLTVIGFPGTIGYIAEELVLQGRFNHSLWQGAASLLIVGLNAWILFRAFARIFLGSAPSVPRSEISLSSRERFALLAFVVLILFDGIAPNLFFRFMQ